MLEVLIKDKIDIFLISETKLDSSFPSGQFVIKGYSTPFRLDRNQNGGGLLLYVREDIPCRILTEYTPEKPIENLFVETKLRSRKWLLEVSNSFMEQFCASYNLKSLIKRTYMFQNC